MNNFILKCIIFVVALITLTTLIMIIQTSQDLSPKLRYTKYIYKNFENEENIENLPLIYIEENAKLPSNYNESCAIFPKLFDVQFTADHWQTENTTNGTLHLFSAYVDHRFKDSRKGVRIMSMYNRFYSNETFFCQFWYENSKEPAVVKGENVTWVWIKGWGGNNMYHPYIVTCLFPDDKIPMSVSVVDKPCNNATNNLKISYKGGNERKKNFVVCVKGLNFPYEDKSVRLVEWIELLFLLGADKINFYKFHIHPTTQKVLDYYSKRGKVEVTPISLVGGSSNSPYLQSNYLKKKVLQRRLQEVIPFNDCLYKHLQEYKFVVLLDTDEVIVPAEGTWVDLISQIKNDNKSSYIARNIYFLDSYQHDHEWFDGIPQFLHMLQHVYRAENYTKPGYFVKGFHDTRKVVALHNHFPVRCLGNCQHANIDLELAHLQHYRSDCRKEVKDCEEMKKNSVIDKRLWNYKDDLINNVLKVLSEVDLLDDGSIR